VAGIGSARAEARILWEHARGNPAAFSICVQRRLSREPIAYIVGRREFWSLDFEVGPGVLIPRPETETLMDQALREWHDRSCRYRILDLGIGSGCLLTALLKEYSQATGVGVDASECALQWARRNVRNHGLEARVELLNIDWNSVGGSFDFIVCNPPYIRTAHLAGLAPDVRDYEPIMALDGGKDGLAGYRNLSPTLVRCLKPNGTGFIEIGAGQEEPVSAIMTGGGLTVLRSASDLAGIPRCLVVCRS